MVTATKDVRSVGHRNEVVLTGRLSGLPEEREMPSGDVVVTFRLVVDRPEQKLPEGVRRTTIDTIDCAAWLAAARRSAASWDDGDVLEVAGSIRRRFFQGPSGSQSRVEVEVAKVKRVARA
jgi:single-strand DNA-binding protein